jgi:catechol 2,3-dioxygenase-like lactoylglutathione lyase family enzyme
MAKAQEWYKRVFGVKHFGTLEAEMGAAPESPLFYRGKPARASIRLVLGDMNGTEIELIEPRTEGSLWAEHFKTDGPGLHHVCFMVPEFEPAMSLFSANGFDPVIQGSNRNGGLHVEFAYFVCRASGASYVELIWANDVGRAFMRKLRIGKRPKILGLRRTKHAECFMPRTLPMFITLPGRSII